MSQPSSQITRHKLTLNALQTDLTFLKLPYVTLDDTFIDLVVEICDKLISQMKNHLPLHITTDNVHAEVMHDPLLRWLVHSFAQYSSDVIDAIQTLNGIHPNPKDIHSEAEALTLHLVKINALQICDQKAERLLMSILSSIRRVMLINTARICGYQPGTPGIQVKGNNSCTMTGRDALQIFYYDHVLYQWIYNKPWKGDASHIYYQHPQELIDYIHDASEHKQVTGQPDIDDNDEIPPLEPVYDQPTALQSDASLPEFSALSVDAPVEGISVKNTTKFQRTLAQWREKTPTVGQIKAWAKKKEDCKVSGCLLDAIPNVACTLFCQHACIHDMAYAALEPESGFCQCTDLWHLNRVERYYISSKILNHYMSKVQSV